MLVTGEESQGPNPQIPNRWFLLAQLEVKQQASGNLFGCLFPCQQIGFILSAERLNFSSSSIAYHQFSLVWLVQPRWDLDVAARPACVQLQQGCFGWVLRRLLQLGWGAFRTLLRRKDLKSRELQGALAIQQCRIPCNRFCRGLLVLFGTSAPNYKARLLLLFALFLMMLGWWTN